MAVQVLRTYPSRRPRYPFAPDGERSVARGSSKAVERARTLIYIEDQYFWSVRIAKILSRALRRHPELRLLVVLPRTRIRMANFRVRRADWLRPARWAIVQHAGGERVGIFDVENEIGSPIYVHAKVCVIDDVWSAVGSDNLNRRS